MLLWPLENGVLQAQNKVPLAYLASAAHTANLYRILEVSSCRLACFLVLFVTVRTFSRAPSL
jgi:hypothetical protein